MRQKLLADDQIQALLDDARQFYPQEDLVSSLIASSNPYITSSYTDDDNTHRQFATKRLEDILTAHVERLFDGYRLVLCGLFIKVPGAGWLDLHHHPTVVDHPKHWVVDIWCPLVDTDLNNGTLCVVPESHKIFPQTIGHPSDLNNGTHCVAPESQKIFPNTVCHPGTIFCKEYASIIREDHSLALPSKAGDALIFEGSLLHWSPINKSDSARYAVHCMCIPIEATAVYTHYDPAQAYKFDLYKATGEYFERDFGGRLSRPRDLEFLKTIPNLNRLYSQAEFKERLANAAEIRHNLFPESQFVADSLYRELLQQENLSDDQFESIAIPTEFTVAPLLERAVNQDSSDQPMSLDAALSTRSRISSRLTSVVKRLWIKMKSRGAGASKPFLGQIQSVQRNAHQAINQYSTSDVEQYYDEMTSSYIQGFGEVFQGSRPESTKELVDYLIQAAKLEDDLVVLDAGCGVCGPATLFAQRCKIKIEALTLSSAQVAEAQERIASRGLQNQISVRQGDYHQLDQIYDANSFDRVLFLESLCHAEDYRKALCQAKHVLKPGGFLYIKDFYAIDNRSRPELLELQAKDLEALNNLYRLVVPDLPSMVDLISELGFVIFFMRMPQYIYSPIAWQNFMEHTNQFWIRESGEAICAVEFLAYKPA